MKMTLPALIATAILATTSFTTLAATQVDQEQSQDLQAIGTVSINSVSGSLDDANRQLQVKAEEQGASHYRIIRADTPGDSSKWSGTAEIYR